MVRTSKFISQKIALQVAGLFLLIAGIEFGEYYIIHLEIIPQQEIAKIEVLSGAILIIFGLITFYHLYRKLILPLEKIASQMQELGEGNLSIPITVEPRTDEIGDMQKTLLMFQRNAIAVHENQERFDLAVRGSGVALWDWKINTDELYISPKLFQLLGHASCQNILTNMQKLTQQMHPEDVEIFEIYLKKHLSEQQEFLCEVRLKKQSGEYSWFSIQGQALWNASGAAVRMAGSMKDVDYEKQVERQISQYIQQVEGMNLTLDDAKKEALYANKLKGEFLANMSHEIRTPLNGVIGMTGMLSGTSLNQQQKEYTNIIMNSAQNLLQLINDILDFSKIESGKMVLEPIPFNLDLTLKEVLDLLSLKAEEKGIELLVRYAADVPYNFVGDPGRIRQVLYNLVGNAIKFTHEGHVYINIEKSESDEHSVLLKISVEDTGIGIPEDKQYIIFEKFSQGDASTTRKFGGTGLGLSISRQIIQMMGGNMRVESVYGKGSVFTFTLRLPINGDICPLEIAPKALKNLRVLVVDDNELNRVLLVEQLQQLGMMPLALDSAEKAVEILTRAKAQKAAFSIALIDYRMPSMDGVALANAIQGNKTIKGTKCVMLASAREVGDDAKWLNAGFSGYLLKPVWVHQLAEVLGKAMSRHRYSEQRTLITAGDYHQESDVAYSAASKEFKGIRVLLAEDNPVNQMVATKLLEKFGCQITTAGNGLEALELLKRMPFDIILMDCSMPIMDGFEATKQIIEMQSKGTLKKLPPIIAVTAHAMKGDRERCLKAGMNDYISKPLAEKDLGEILGHWSGKKSKRSEKYLPEKRTPAKNTKKVHADDWRIQNLKKNLGDAFVRVIGTYIKVGDELTLEIQSLAKAKDMKKLSTTSHSLVSSSLQVGATTLATLARQLENEAEKLSARELKKLIVEIGTEYQSVKKELTEVLLLEDTAPKLRRAQ